MTFVGSGKAIKSTVTWPNTPFEYRISPMDFEIVNKFMLGRETWGKKAPTFRNSFPENLSKEPIKSISPLGSMKNDIEGDEIWLGRHVGLASIIPPY